MFFVCVGCKSDQEKKEEVKEFIKVFVQDIKLENREKLINAYPSITEIGEYWVPNGFELVEVTKNENLFYVYGKFKVNNQFEKQLMFEVKEEGGTYKISSSKGLSTLNGGSLHDFLTKMGCLSLDDNDKALVKLVSENEFVYDDFIEELKSKVVENIEVDNSHLSSNGGYYISGNLILTNKNGFDIPGSAYSVDMAFINTRTQTVVDKQHVNEFYPKIPAYSSVSIQIDYISINGGNKVAGIVNIENNQSILVQFNEAIIKKLGNMGLNCDNWQSQLGSILYSL
jgi:hypothetical protein